MKHINFALKPMKIKSKIRCSIICDMVIMTNKGIKYFHLLTNHKSTVIILDFWVNITLKLIFLVSPFNSNVYTLISSIYNSENSSINKSSNGQFYLMYSQTANRLEFKFIDQHMVLHDAYSILRVEARKHASNI